MKQTYNVGYLQTPSVKHLANVKQALADTGLASPTTPNEMLPTAIEEGLAELKPENILGRVKIGQVEGTIVKTIEDVSFNTYEVDFETYLKKKGFSNVYIAKNMKDAYCSYSSSSKTGIYHVDLLTEETTQIYSDSYYYSAFFEDDNENIYTYTSKTRGTIHIKGKVATKISDRTISKFTIHKGILYAGPSDSSSDYIQYLVSLNGTEITNIYSGAYGSFLKDSRGNLYVGGVGTTVYNNNAGLLKVEGMNATKISSAATVFRYLTETPSGKLVFFTYNLNGTVLIIDTNDNDKIRDVYVSGTNIGATKFYETSDGVLYAGNGSSVFSIVKIKDYIASIIPLPITNYNITEVIITKKDTIFVKAGYIFSLDKDTDALEQLTSSATTYKYIEDDDGILYFCDYNEIFVSDGEKVTKFTKTQYTAPSFFYTDKNNIITLCTGGAMYKLKLDSITEITTPSYFQTAKLTPQGTFFSDSSGGITGSTNAYFSPDDEHFYILKQKI